MFGLHVAVQFLLYEALKTVFADGDDERLYASCRVDNQQARLYETYRTRSCGPRCRTSAPRMARERCSAR